MHVKYAPGKTEQMHLIPKTSKLKSNEPNHGINMGGLTIAPSTTIKSLGIYNDRRLSFRTQVTAATSKAAKLISMVSTLTKRKGISPGAIHHLARTTILPNLLWGSDAWWTGAEHITRQIGPIYNRIARYIKNHPRWTKTAKLLAEARLPPPPTPPGLQIETVSD